MVSTFRSFGWKNGKLLEDSVFRTVRSHLVLCCNMSPRCVRAMGVCRALAYLATPSKVGEGKSGPVETGLTGPVATALFYALTTEPLDPWQRSRSKSAYKSQARGLSRLQLSFFLSPSNTLPYCEWRSQVDRVVGLEWIDCTSTLPEQILSLSTTPASGSIISQCIVACSTISLEC